MSYRTRILRQLRNSNDTPPRRRSSGSNRKNFRFRKFRHSLCIWLWRVVRCTRVSIEQFLPLARDCCRLDGWILINRNDHRGMQNHRSFDSRVTRCTRFLSRGTRSSDHRILVHACSKYLAASICSLSRRRRWRLSREASWQFDQRPKQQKHQTNIQTCRQTNGQTYEWTDRQMYDTNTEKPGGSEFRLNWRQWGYYSAGDKTDKRERQRQGKGVHVGCYAWQCVRWETMVDSPASNQDHLHVAWRRPLCRFFAEGAVRSGESSSFACGDRI